MSNQKKTKIVYVFIGLWHWQLVGKSEFGKRGKRQMRVVCILSQDRGGNHCRETGMGRTKSRILVGKPEAGHASRIDKVRSGCQRYQGHRHLLPDARLGMCGQERASVASRYHLVRFKSCPIRSKSNWNVGRGNVPFSSAEFSGKLYRIEAGMD